MSEAAEIRFPCETCPDDAGQQRLLGLYDMRQEGLLMQRLKVHAGRITPGQWRAVAELARQYTPGYPLHLTTRQDIEFHGLKPADVPAVQRGLAAIGITTVGACGDTLRNVTACPGHGLCPGRVDVSDLVDAIRASIESLPFVRSLPRKFKVSVSGCERACSRPFINDVGLVALPDATFRATVGGSLGARPGTGVTLYENLGPLEVVPLVIAVFRFFNAEGDREHRTRARLRHVRERIGEKAFRQEIDRCFREELANSTWPATPVRRVGGDGRLLARWHFPLGDIEPDVALELASAAERAQAALRIGCQHDLLLFGRTTPELSDELQPLAANPIIVACPGVTWCQRGLADSRAAETRLRTVLPDRREWVIGISGCPDNCSHAAVSDVGLIGRIKTIDGARTECFRLLAGGGKGRTPALAEELHPAAPATDVHRLVAGLLDEYEQLPPAGSFTEFVTREKDRLSQHLREQVDRGPEPSEGE